MLLTFRSLFLLRGGFWGGQVVRYSRVYFGWADFSKVLKPLQNQLKYKNNRDPHFVLASDSKTNIKNNVSN